MVCVGQRQRRRALSHCQIEHVANLLAGQVHPATTTSRHVCRANLPKGVEMKSGHRSRDGLRRDARLCAASASVGEDRRRSRVQNGSPIVSPFHRKPRFTFHRHVLDAAETRAEPETKPDRPLHDLGRKAVAAKADLGHHRWLRLKSLDGEPTLDATRLFGTIVQGRICRGAWRHALRPPFRMTASSCRNTIQSSNPIDFC